MLKFDKASVGYGKRVVVDNIDIDIKQGEIITLIGPNGAGKSTILKTITKQLEMIAGEIVLAQNNISRLNEKQLAELVSMVVTERLSTELMTCRDVVATGRYPYTGRLGILSSRDMKIVQGAIDRVEASEVADLDFMKISDGQRQRVMLARALCQEPQVMVLDEPTSYLDLKYKLSLINTIKELARRDKITIVMSLHELELANGISDRIICVKNNKVDKVGTPDEIFTKHYISCLFDVDVEKYETELGLSWLL